MLKMISSSTHFKSKYGVSVRVGKLMTRIECDLYFIIICFFYVTILYVDLARTQARRIYRKE